MLCFNYTVGFPLSVPVLSQLFLATGATNPCEPAFWSRPAVHTPEATSELPRSSNHRTAFNVFEARPCSPTLRANPFPEVTDLFCRLPLPTFFYQLEAANLGDLMRLWVRSVVIINRSVTFSRAVKSAPDTPEIEVLSQTANPISE